MPYKDKEFDKAKRSAPEYRERLNARNREKYQNDAEYRTRVNETNKQRMREKRLNDPIFREKQNEYKRLWKWRDVLKQRYGMTVEEYHALYTLQNGKCAICGTDLINAINNGQKDAKNNFQTCVDHDHKTGKVRGLLCWHCNTALGHFRDNAEILIKAANYLKGGDVHE